MNKKKFFIIMHNAYTQIISKNEACTVTNKEKIFLGYHNFHIFEGKWKQSEY